MLYLAGKYSSQARLRAIRARIRSQLGIECSSSWLDEKYESDEEATPETRAENALRDLTEVLGADVFVIDTLDESATGGREVEFGLALASMLPIALVGPRRNVFHYLGPVVQFDSWEAWFEEGERAGRELGYIGTTAEEL